MPEKEPYSREAYDEAEREVEEAKGEISPEKPTEELRAAVERRAGAEEKRDRLFEMSWDEALELNRQYDELLAKKDAIDQELATFRREKLGMPEPEREKPERTRETEIQANVELWQSLGIEVDEADVRAQIEALPKREGFDWFHYIPEGIKNSQLIKLMEDRFPVWVWEGVGDPDKIKMPRTTKESYAVACRLQQEPDKDSLGENAKSALDWEKTEDQFMSPLERMVAELRWQKEQGSHLDEKYWTWCPGSRAAGDRVPYLSFVDDEVCLSADHPEVRDPFLGVRRVVSKES